MFWFCCQWIGLFTRESTGGNTMFFSVFPKEMPKDFDKTRDIDTFVEQNADAETCATRMVMICQLHGCHWPTGYVGLTHGFFVVVELLGLHSIAMDYTWLLVLTILKTICQLGWLFPIYGKMKHVANHQPVLCVILYVWFNKKWCVAMLPLGAKSHQCCFLKLSTANKQLALPLPNKP